MHWTVKEQIVKIYRSVLPLKFRSRTKISALQKSNNIIELMGNCVCMWLLFSNMD